MILSIATDRINPSDTFVVANQIGLTRVGVRAIARNMAGRFVAVGKLIVAAVVEPVAKVAKVVRAPIARTIVLLAAYVVAVRNTASLFVRALRFLGCGVAAILRSFILNDIVVNGRTLVAARRYGER